MRRLLPICVLLAAVPASAQAPPSYSRQIQPLFTRYCVECHNARDPEGNLDLASYKTLLEGGGHGAAIEPGKPDTSRLVRMIEGKLKPVMPPKKSKQPTPAEIALIRAWVLAGARDDTSAARITLPALPPRTRVRTPITALVHLADGKTLAASGRGEVLLLDLASGDVTQRLPAGRDRVTGLALGKTGLLAVAASTTGEGHEVRLFRGTRFTQATRHDDVILDVTFAPDGKLLATAGYDRLIKLWDVEAGKEVRVLKDHSDSVYGVSFSPDGMLLASGGADRAVKVWDVATGNRLYTLGESTDWVYAVAFSPDGKHLAAAGVDRSIRVWQVDAKGGRVVQSAFAHEGPITRLIYSRDGRTLYSLGEDRRVKVWDAGTLVEQKGLPRQPEAPLSFALRAEPKELAVGLFDGALVLIDPVSGKVTRQLLPQKPRPAVIEKITPAVLVRGRTTEVRVVGKHLVGSQVTSTSPGASAKVTNGTETTLSLAVTISAGTLPGTYQLRVNNGAGDTGPVSFVVDRFPAREEAEPNDSPRTGQSITLPLTVAGTIGKPGDIDWFRFEAKANQEVGVQILTSTIGSKLDPYLRLVDPDGNTVAESTSGILGHTCTRAGWYALGIRDGEYRGDPGMTYRLAIGDIPVVTSVFPLGLARGSKTDVRLEGVHLGKVRTVKVEVPATAAIGSRVPVAFTTPEGPPLGSATVVVGEFTEVVGNGKDRTIPLPGTANGVIATPGATQTWRFEARKGQRLILEVEASRIGSALDSTLEILDGTGRPLPRAVLRSLARTYVVFRDHEARAPGIRIEAWSELAVNDWMLVGSELLRIRALPRNPDDDCQFFAAQGQRLGFLGTTPSFQSQGTPMYKVGIHPPGTTFPPNGLPVVTLFWRNDDGGPGLGKDSRLVFDPPADGVYQLRVGDARGEGGSGFGYRLTVREPRPDFTVSISAPATVSRGGAVPVRVNVRRLDEFDGVIDVKLPGLPAGFQAPATNVPAGENDTAFALFAEEKAPIPPKSITLDLEARATIAGKEVVRKASGTLPRPTEPGDIVTTTRESEVKLVPGGEARVTVDVERRNGFKGRIPLEVQGLPHGVRVLDVGLNGILITQAESRRTFVLFCEPWVQPMNHPIVVLARREGKGTEHAAKSVLMQVAGRSSGTLVPSKSPR